MGHQEPLYDKVTGRNRWSRPKDVRVVTMELPGSWRETHCNPRMLGTRLTTPSDTQKEEFTVHFLSSVSM